MQDHERAVFYHELGLGICKEVGDRGREGLTCSRLGNDHHNLGDFKKAIHYHELALKIAKEVGNRAAEGCAYGNLGNGYGSLGDVKRAIHYCELHLKTTKELGDRTGEGQAYGNLGLSYHGLADFRKAIHYHELHLGIVKETGDRHTEGNVYGALGNSYRHLGELKKAIHYQKLSLEVAKEVGNKTGQGIVYGYLGNSYANLGDFREAIQYHELQLKFAKEVGNRNDERSACGSLGNDYACLGDYKKAIEFHELSLKLSKDIGNKAAEGYVYGFLGNDYRYLGELTKAIHYDELHLQIAKQVGDKAMECGAYGNLGKTYRRQGNFKEAIRYLELYLKVAKDLGIRRQEGDAYSCLGHIHESSGDFKKAIHYFELDLEIAKEVGDKSSEGNAYGNLGGNYASCRDFKTAVVYQELHLKFTKETGNRDEEGVAYFNLGTSYESLGRLPHAVTCYQSSVGALNDVRARLQFKDELKISLRQQYENSYTALWSTLLKQGKVMDALIACEQGRAQALEDLMEFKYEFQTSPRESCMMNHVDKLCCLPPNTLFEAILKEEVVFTWLIQDGKEAKLNFHAINDNLSGDAIPSINALIKLTFDEIGVRARVKCEDRSLDNLPGEVLTSERSSETQFCPLDQSNALRTLHEVIIAPITDLINGRDELLIVPDGPLCLAPYAALMDSNAKYLSESLRIRIIPSLTSLKLIADCPSDYHHKRGALLVGDPWVQDVVSYNLKQLPCAREEVAMIGRILNTEPLTGTKATKDEVLKRLSSVALVHIAAHGSMETGEIALAPNLSRETQEPQEADYLLRITDVLNIELRARLVVLSCCHSGRGEIKAEGVVGIARAFLGAGARSVLVSLWAINDEATLEFMKVFYQYLLDGRSASEALNRAMKSMRESEKFRKVKYWAPFVLIGDDVTLEFGGGD